MNLIYAAQGKFSLTTFLANCENLQLSKLLCVFGEKASTVDKRRVEKLFETF